MYRLLAGGNIWMSQMSEEWLVPAWPGYWEKEAEECCAGPDKAGLGTAHTADTARSSNTQLKISPTRPFCCLEISQHNTPGSELVARKQELSHPPTHSQSHHSITPPEITGVTSCPCHSGPDVWPVPGHRQCPHGDCSLLQLCHC